MDKTEIIFTYQYQLLDGKTYKNFINDLDQLINSTIDDCAKIVNDKITGDLTPNEEHLLIEILKAIRSE